MKATITALGSTTIALLASLSGNAIAAEKLTYYCSAQEDWCQLMANGFEEATGMSGGGPTQVMRMEHEQMRGVLAQMAAAVERGDFDELVDQGDTLNVLIQQHNMKEEGMLYPMAERALDAAWPELRARVAAFEAR